MARGPWTDPVVPLGSGPGRPGSTVHSVSTVVSRDGWMGGSFWMSPLTDGVTSPRQFFIFVLTFWWTLGWIPKHLVSLPSPPLSLYIPSHSNYWMTSVMGTLQTQRIRRNPELSEPTSTHQLQHTTIHHRR